jgi:hypothetical protein
VGVTSTSVPPADGFPPTGADQQHRQGGQPLEEQFYLGADPEAQVDYGVAEGQLVAYAAEVRCRARQFGVRELGREASVSVGTLSSFVRGKATPSLRILRAIDRATRC